MTLFFAFLSLITPPMYPALTLSNSWPLPLCHICVHMHICMYVKYTSHMSYTYMYIYTHAHICIYFLNIQIQPFQSVTCYLQIHDSRADHSLLDNQLGAFTGEDSFSHSQHPLTACNSLFKLKSDNCYFYQVLECFLTILMYVYKANAQFLTDISNSMCCVVPSLQHIHVHCFRLQTESRI